MRQAFAAGQRASTLVLKTPSSQPLQRWEDDPLFNAKEVGFTANGTVETDAAVMTGDGHAGAVCFAHVTPATRFN